MSLPDVQVEALGPDEGPLVVRPGRPHMDLASWLAEAKAALAPTLSRHGALVFRGFGLTDRTDFDRTDFDRTVEPLLGAERARYVDRVTRRTSLGGGMYTSTETPPDYEIQLHCESSFSSAWPARLAFFCVRPARAGGATTLADVRRVHDAIPSDVRALFLEKGVRYARTFGRGPGLSSSEAFPDDLDDAASLATDPFTRVEQRGDRLYVDQARPAVIRHPGSGAPAWFNHVRVFHVDALPADLAALLRRQRGVNDLPQHCTFGDGTPIDSETFEAVRAAYAGAQLEIEWEAGDLAWIDNLAVAHGRRRYEGEREVLVSMSAPLAWSDVEVLGRQPARPSERARNGAVADTATPVDDARLSVVCAVVGEVLECSSVSANDGFLDLGGDSLSAMRVIGRLADRHGIEIDIDSLFSATLAELSIR